MIKTHADFFSKIFTSHFIARVRKGLLKVCVWEGAGDRTETSIFWPPLLWLSILCLSPSSDAQPEVQRPTLLGDGFLYGILSASSPDLNSSGPKDPFGLMWLSLPHLVYNSADLQLSWLLSWLSYIIVQRPLDRPLDLWNRMFNRHQVEITIMQFRGHSLPVRQSMSVSWDFFSSSHFISQFPPTRFPLITAIKMCHFLSVHHLEWHLGRVEGQNITIPLIQRTRCLFKSGFSIFYLFRTHFQIGKITKINNFTRLTIAYGRPKFNLDTYIGPASMIIF